MQQQQNGSPYDPRTNELRLLAIRWRVSAATILRWHAANSKQYLLLTAGMKKRENAALSTRINNLSLFVQQHGIFIKDVVRLSGLTRQTLNRLARKKRTTCRLRDLVAGTAVLLAAPTEDTACESNGGQQV